MLIQKDFKQFIKDYNKLSIGQSLSKTPDMFFDYHGYPEYKFLIGSSYVETRNNIYSYVYGEKNCVVCKKIVTKLVSWKCGWPKTCSVKCENLHRSNGQLGNNNTCHRMSESSKNNMKIKLSETMKKKILVGEFTPKSENYKLFGMIEFKYKNTIRKVRSLWELIYWLENEHLEYEKIRLPYYDSIEKRNRIYITDFYDSISNTIIEIKPIKYQNKNYLDKKKSCLDVGYNFLVVDEKYFNSCKTESVVTKIKDCVIDYKKIEKRMKWLKKV